MGIQKEDIAEAAGVSLDAVSVESFYHCEWLHMH